MIELKLQLSALITASSTTQQQQQQQEVVGDEGPKWRPTQKQAQQQSQPLCRHSFHQQQRHHKKCEQHEQQQQQQQHEQREQQQPHAYKYHARNYVAIHNIFTHSIATLYLWWLFGTCLILFANSGSSAQFGTSKMSMLVAAAYLEPDELISEWDRPVPPEKPISIETIVDSTRHEKRTMLKSVNASSDVVLVCEVSGAKAYNRNSIGLKKSRQESLKSNFL